MREEYDFTNAVRGRHAERYAEGVEVEILEESSGIDAWQEKADVVRLDPDVRAIFPDSRAVNDALRVLIKTVEKMVVMRKAS